MTYVYLTIAIVAEAIATSALKASERFTRLVPSIFVVAGYLCAFYFLTTVLETVPVGVVYAMWAGLGIVLVAILGAILYRERLDWAAILGIVMILGGVVVMHLFSKSISHG
jgi:small multidrug resistance pump